MLRSDPTSVESAAAHAPGVQAAPTDASRAARTETCRGWRRGAAGTDTTAPRRVPSVRSSRRVSPGLEEPIGPWRPARRAVRPETGQGTDASPQVLPERADRT